MTPPMRSRPKADAAERVYRALFEAKSRLAMEWLGDREQILAAIRRALRPPQTPRKRKEKR